MDNNNNDWQDDLKYEQYIERDIRDPIPTVGVPYKIIKKPTTKSRDYLEQPIKPNKTEEYNSGISSLEEENKQSESQLSDWMTTDHDKW